MHLLHFHPKFFLQLKLQYFLKRPNLPLDKDYAFDKLSIKINTPKDVLIKELKYKETAQTSGSVSSSPNNTNKHIESFQDIFLSSLIKNNFEKSDDFKDLYDANNDISNIVKKLQADEHQELTAKYKNISFTDDQLHEAISRLYIHYFEIKINSLVTKLEDSNDIKIFSQIEKLKKKIENFQNTL